MLFLITWTMYADQKVDCYKAFSKMTPAEDKMDMGDNIHMVGRWHDVGGGRGACVCETNDVNALTAWMTNWAGMCDIKVVPVVEDETVRSVIRSNPIFQDTEA